MQENTDKQEGKNQPTLILLNTENIYYRFNHTRMLLKQGVAASNRLSD